MANTPGFPGVSSFNALPWIWLTGAFKFSPLPRRQAFKGPLAYCPANQPQRGKPDPRRHAPDLAISAFAQQQFEPTDRNRRPIPDWRISRPKSQWLGNTPHPTGPRHKIAQIYSRSQFKKSLIARQPFDLHPVELFELVPRIGDACLQRPIVGQYDQALGIRIEPAGGVYAGNRYVVRQRPTPMAVSKLGQRAIGLIEQY